MMPLRHSTPSRRQDRASEIPMTDSSIRPLAAGELESALTLSSTAGWNQRLDDWRLLLTIAPAGSVAAVVEERIVGTAIGIDYGGFGWIAMMLVDPAYRGQGFGRGLLQAAMDAIPPDRPIRLDATPMGRPLYRSFGFVEEASLSRLVAGPSARHVPPADASIDVHALAGTDLRAIAEQDRETFGGNRAAVLEWALARAPDYAHVVRDAGDLQHYCFGRRGRLFDQVGPVVAADARTAQSLVSAALGRSGDRAIAIDVFDDQVELTGWLHDSGFRVERPLFRMCRPAPGGSPFRGGPAPGEFAIFGPEFG